MKRDDDYIRDLLLEAEASDQPYIHAFLTLDADPNERKRYVHAKWLSDAKLFDEEEEFVFRLTNQGHDYLAAIRDEGVWENTKEVATKAGGVTLGVMGDIAIELAKRKALDIFQALFP